MYEKRMRHCQRQAIIGDVESRKYWREAAELYQHLINCKSAHSAKKLKAGLSMCKEFGV